MKKGSITIFLSLVLVSVLLLVSIITEAARMNVVQTECKGFTYLASDSVLAGYARQIYTDYGVLLVWEDKTIKEQLMKYLQANINLADLNPSGTNIMATRLKDINIEKTNYVVRNGGEDFIKQVLSYMKYAVATEAVSKLINLYSNNSNQKKSDTSEYMVNVEEKDSSEIREIVDEINNRIKNLQGRNIKKELKTEKKRTGFLKYINKIIEKIKIYKEEKKEFLKENRGKSGNDYMDSNFKILEQIKNTMEREELIESGNLKEKWKRIGEEISTQVRSLTVKTSTEEDQKNMGIYENAKKLLEKGILSLVIDDVSNISSASVQDSNLPSKKDYNKTTSFNNITDKAKMVMYAGMKFGNYRNVKKKSSLSYELEYMIAGKDNDRSNLTATVEQMVSIRNMTALAYLLTDQKKMAELSSIASSASTAVGVPFLEPIIKAVLTEAWALAEAINDVKIMMLGKKIDFIKNSGNWKTGLRNMLAVQNNGSDKKGDINYQQFCYLLLMKKSIQTITVRMLDIIQMNVKKNYNHLFDINQCFTGFCLKAVYESEPLFVSMPWVIHNLGQKIGAYSFAVKCKADFKSGGK